ncbi:MAG TPA: hypothetical protein VHC69_09295 [Polyangiaceae bacterium]|nr:hypothetical protein [Polyangiaceae bacterium]
MFTIKAFDTFVTGNANVYTPTAIAEQLGGADRIHGSGIVFNPQGSFPTITVQFEHSFDGTRWISQRGTPELNAQGLVVGSDTLFWFGNTLTPLSTGFDPSVNLMNYVRIRIALGGGSPSGGIQVWLCGRSPNR